MRRAERWFSVGTVLTTVHRFLTLASKYSPKSILRIFAIRIAPFPLNQKVTE
jgi:hypothetical protein